MGGSHWHIFGKHFITVIDAAKMFYQWRMKHEHRNRSVVISPWPGGIQCCNHGTDQVCLLHPTRNGRGPQGLCWVLQSLYWWHCYRQRDARLAYRTSSPCLLSNTRTWHHDWALKSYIGHLSRYLFPFRTIRLIFVLLVSCCANILSKTITLALLGGAVRLQRCVCRLI